MEEKKIISALLTHISLYHIDDIYRDTILDIKVHNKNEVSIFLLCIKGERDKNTPFYCGTIMTHIVREDYYNGKVVWAEIIYEEERGDLYA